MNLLAVALATTFVAAAACSGGGSNGGGTPTPTGSPSPTSSASPTPAVGDATFRVMVECTNSGCATGRLRTYLFNCTSGLAIVLRTDQGVGLIAGTAFVADLRTAAPVSGCIQASLDDTAGNNGISSATSQIDAAVGDTKGATVLFDYFGGL